MSGNVHYDSGDFWCDLVSSNWDQHVTFVVARVQSQCEAKVASRIRDGGLEVFFPRESRMVIRNGRRATKTTPLFPCYLLINCPGNDNRSLSLIMNTRDVFGLIKTSDNSIATICDVVIDEIKSRCTADGFFLARKNRISNFKYGDRVSPRSGPLQYHVGRFEAALSLDYVMALFSLFGRDMKVRFKQGDLVAA